MKQNAGVIALVLRVCLGAWFVYAGGLKIFGSGLERFVTDVENYQLVSGPLAMVAAFVVPWVEVVAGVCFMLGILRQGAWATMLGLVVVFTVAVGSAWWRGLDITCGCFGGDEPISYWRKVVEFSIYYAALAFIGWAQWRAAGPDSGD